jgi:hypothetical protein
LNDDARTPLRHHVSKLREGYAMLLSTKLFAIMAVALALSTGSAFARHNPHRHDVKTVHHPVDAARPAPRQAVSTGPSDSALESGIGGAGTLNAAGQAFEGPARGGIGH